MSNRMRVYFTGVGGQGTLTATSLAARTALLCGLPVVAGEVHGMAQRGGVVESVLLLGGLRSPKLDYGEADLILGFEPLETLRGLVYLREGGCVISSKDPIPPLSVSLGKSAYPSLESVQKEAETIADKCIFLPVRDFGKEAGSIQSGNIALLACACLLNYLPFSTDRLQEAIERYLPAKVQKSNLRVVETTRAYLTQNKLL